MSESLDLTSLSDILRENYRSRNPKW